MENVNIFYLIVLVVDRIFGLNSTKDSRGCELFIIKPKHHLDKKQFIQDKDFSRLLYAKKRLKTFIFLWLIQNVKQQKI